jgi:enamine deaminase RidA (YjgF/YER057c/UK114 family)
MSFDIVRSSLVPPSGPISQATRVGPHIWTAQIPKDPISGRIIPGGIEEQTDRVLENLRLTLEGAGGSLADVVQVTVFIIDAADAPGMNTVWKKRFSPPYPNRATVLVAGLLGEGVRIEITAQAFVGDLKAVR